MFETGLGEFLSWLLVLGYHAMMITIQGLAMIPFFYTIFLVFISWKKPERDYQHHAPEKKFLVFVPSHNEENVVGHIIENLLFKMNYPKELFDVYVIADNCSDSTAAISRSAGANVIEHFSAPGEPKGKPYGIKYALDYIGDRLSNYDYVAIFDADNLVGVDYFAEMNSQLLSDPTIKVSQGYLDAKNVDSSIVSLGYSMAYYQTNRFFCYARNKIKMSPVIGGTGFVMDVKVLEEIGWTVNSLTEDLEFQMQCVLNNYRIVWNHFAPIYDEKPTEYTQSIIQRVRWSRGHWTVKHRYFNDVIKKSFLAYYREGRIDGVSLDAALYIFAPFIAGTSLIALVANMILFPAQTFVLVGVILAAIFISVHLAKYAMKADSKQTSNSSVGRMMLGMLWYTISSMFIHIYGMLTYKQNVWVRTEHKVDTAIEDLFSVLEK
ncbi:MAG: glycosyltransferase family 2 protein [Culicoidibacterales bacterium]